MSKKLSLSDAKVQADAEKQKRIKRKKKESNKHSKKHEFRPTRNFEDNPKSKSKSKRKSLYFQVVDTLNQSAHFLRAFWIENCSLPHQDFHFKISSYLGVSFIEVPFEDNQITADRDLLHTPFTKEIDKQNYELYKVLNKSNLLKPLLDKAADYSHLVLNEGKLESKTERMLDLVRSVWNRKPIFYIHDHKKMNAQLFYAAFTQIFSFIALLLGIDGSYPPSSDKYEAYDWSKWLSPRAVSLAQDSYRVAIDNNRLGAHLEYARSKDQVISIRDLIIEESLSHNLIASRMWPIVQKASKKQYTVVNELLVDLQKQESVMSSNIYDILSIATCNVNGFGSRRNNAVVSKDNYLTELTVHAVEAFCGSLDARKSINIANPAGNVVLSIRVIVSKDVCRSKIIDKQIRIHYYAVYKKNQIPSGRNWREIATLKEIKGFSSFEEFVLA